MEVRELSNDPVEIGRWDAFVAACPTASFFHLAGWRRVIATAFGQPTWFLYAQRDGEVSGVLPLAHVRSRLFGNKLVSLPFCVYGGVAATDGASGTALIAAAGRLARQLGVDFLELRQVAASGAELPNSDRYVTFRRALDADPEVNLKAVPRKQRAMIRKGAAAGLVPAFDTSVERFFAIYAESLRNLGTPVLPRRYFAILKEVFGDACEIMSVSPGGDAPAVAAVMSAW